ncbi:MAG TPA: hypothetical protein VKT49_21310 [Bryobacteraceae bacterium]|nr:hypothetical protein [Bryobacteraceae bacterium]
MISTQRPKDGRSSRRFPLALSLRYQVAGSKKAEIHGSEKTLNLSSRGVLFESQDDLCIGGTLKLYIDWPARIDDKVGLILHIVGQIVRTSGISVAAKIQRYEFRTRSSSDVGGPQDLVVPSPS